MRLLLFSFTSTRWKNRTHHIEGQNLATRGNFGYVVLYVNTEAPREVIAALEAMPESIRVVAH